jgi:hypothetical protein
MSLEDNMKEHAAAIDEIHDIALGLKELAFCFLEVGNKTMFHRLNGDANELLENSKSAREEHQNVLEIHYSAVEKSAWNTVAAALAVGETLDKEKDHGTEI